MFSTTIASARRSPKAFLRLENLEDRLQPGSVLTGALNMSLASSNLGLLAEGAMAPVSGWEDLTQGTQDVALLDGSADPAFPVQPADPGSQPAPAQLTAIDSVHAQLQAVTDTVSLGLQSFLGARAIGANHLPVNPIGGSNQPLPGPGPQGDPPTYYTVDSPSPIYEAMTTNLEASIPVTGGTVVTDTGGTFIGTLSPVCTPLQVPVSWATWSAPPFAEDPLPAVEFCGGTSVTLTFITATGAPRPVSIWGQEVEPNNFGRFFMTATFNTDAGGVPFTIGKDVDGFAGASLLAAGTTNPRACSITSVTITAPAAAGGFAFAQPRFGDPSC
jgi:hypothetical protein